MALSLIFLSDGVTELENVKSVEFQEAVNSGEDLRPGCVSSACIEIEVFGTQSQAVSEGDLLYYYQITSDGEQVLIGKFYAKPIIQTKNSYKITAYDAAQNLNAGFSDWLKANQANFPMTVYDIVSAACTVAGVTLGVSAWPLSTETVNAFYADGLLCRDILSYAAEMACCFVRCHTDGNLYFDWYTASPYTINPSSGTDQYAYKQGGLDYANYQTTALARVAVHQPGVENSAYIYPEGVSTGNTLHIRDNLLLTNAPDYFFAGVASNIFSNMVSAYRPFQVSMFPRENPFRAGDIVTVTDSQGVSFTTVIMCGASSQAVAILSSTGNKEYADTADTVKAINQLASTIQQVSEESNTSVSGLRSETSALIQQMQEEILSTVSTNYFTNSDAASLAGTISTQISQTSSDITLAFNSLLNDQASAINGQFDTIYSYIQMSGGTITLGQANNPVQLQIRNDGISIIVDGDEVTYWQSDMFVAPTKLEIPEGGRLILGNYAYIPRANGSLDFVWIGA